MSRHDDDYYRPNRNRPYSAWSTVWPFVILLGAAALLLWYFWPSRDQAIDPTAQPRPVTPGEVSAEDLRNNTLYKDAKPSVVHVTTLRPRNARSARDVPEGTGSGFIWDEKGHIVTNYHVVERYFTTQGAVRVTVTFDNQQTQPVRVVGGDPDMDLAVIWVDPRLVRMSWRPLPLAKSSDLLVGQRVFAIGNPYGLEQTMTSGMVSGLGRVIESVSGRPIKGAIQTSAIINPGNSGGPLLDSRGRLIGVTTSILSKTGSWAGIGFAIPVDEVNRVVPELIRNPDQERPSLGVTEAPDPLARQWGVKGVLVLNVLTGGPADQAGLQPTTRDPFRRITLGDVITAIDGQPVASVNDLIARVRRHKVGDTVTLTVLRDEDELQVRVTLAAESR